MTQSATFAALLVEHARVRGHRPALREKHLGIWQTLTWQQVYDRVQKLACGLAALGIKQGDHVAGDVVDDLRLGAEWPAQEHAAHADERLDIGGVRDLGEAIDDPSGQVAFAAHVGCDRAGGADGMH